MKVLKHITAGLLHLEVLGRVPDTAGEQKRRGGRSAPTSMAQQFYNDKLLAGTGVDHSGNFSSLDLVLTYTYQDEYLPADKRAGDVFFQKHVRKVREARRRAGAAN